MTMRDLAWRSTGLALLAAAGGTSLIHRQVMTDQAAGLSSGVDACLGLASFILAMAGALLIINGVRLHDQWCAESQQNRTERDSAKHGEEVLNAETPPAAIDPDAFGSGRTAIAAHLVLQARSASTPTHKSATRLSFDRSNR